MLHCIVYRKHGKIRWAKHSRFQPYEVFRRNIYAMHWPPVFITYLYRANNSQENFCGTLKNRENHNNLAQQIFPHLLHTGQAVQLT